MVGSHHTVSQSVSRATSATSEGLSRNRTSRTAGKSYQAHLTTHHALQERRSRSWLVNRVSNICNLLQEETYFLPPPRFYFFLENTEVLNLIEIYLSLFGTVMQGSRNVSPFHFRIIIVSQIHVFVCMNPLFQTCVSTPIFLDIFVLGNTRFRLK